MGAAALAIVLVAGCETAPPPPPDGNASSTSPSGQPTAPVASGPPAGPPSTAAGLVLAEVRFDPLPGDPPFIEIANVGSVPVLLAGLALALDGMPLALQPAEAALGPGEQLLVVLDGPKDPEPHVVHAAATGPDHAAGSVRLLDADRQVVDRVAWGAGQAGAVSLAVGDFAPAAPELGTTIGRPPGANAPYLPTEWVAYPPPSASPGAPNPVPPVAVLLPMDGAILAGPPSTLEWYPVTGATSYRVQVAADATFSSLLVDAGVTEPQVDLGTLAPGTYVWHVQAIAADGSASGQSVLSGFELRAGVGQVEPAVYHGDPQSGGVHLALADTGTQLNVPWLVQHKDTAMLLLEEPHEQAPMAWDTAHNPPSRYDKADQFNCALAMVAMVNHYYGGDLSQDRIGYEQFKDRQPGPEEDLNYGYGLTSGEPANPAPGYVDQTNAAFAFALGAPVTFNPAYSTYDAVWSDITREIDAGRPVAGAGTHHGYVVTGYAVTNGHRTMTVNDPARGRYTVDLDAARGAPQLMLWLMPAHPTARRQEASVTTDTDADGVVDFDEMERFKTNPNAPDNDGDKVHDKQDIASGIFEPTYGYALDPQPGGPGRDFDSDGIPTERDPDSDTGGCMDGEEDKDADGHRSARETWNFDPNDDACHDLVGTITWTLHRTEDGETSHGVSDDQVTLSVRFDEQDGRWVDAGSSYTWAGSSRTDDNPGDDPEHGYCGEFHDATTSTGGGPFAGSLASSISVEVDRETKQVFVMSWVAGLLQGHREVGTPESNGGPMYCVLKPHDYSQGGGSTQDSQAEWGQVPRCKEPEESVDGRISDDGKSVVFACTDSVTSLLNGNLTVVTTMSVSGQLAFTSPTR